jgi:quercetin dioxygenase-like cupin family protein
MTRKILLSIVFSLCSPLFAIAAEQHSVVSAEQLKWSAPPALLEGAEIAVVAGDPSKEEPYVIRLKAPAGFKIMPHTHPNTENVTVISGTFNLGTGAKFDEAKLVPINAGGFVQVPSGMEHYVLISEDTLIQLHGVGPTGITYVNPADDPRKSN